MHARVYMCVCLYVLKYQEHVYLVKWPPRVGFYIPPSLSQADASMCPNWGMKNMFRVGQRGMGVAGISSAHWS